MIYFSVPRLFKKRNREKKENGMSVDGWSFLYLKKGALPFGGAYCLFSRENESKPTNGVSPVADCRK